MELKFKNLRKLMESQNQLWPNYIDPITGQDLTQSEDSSGNIYLESKTRKYPVINSIPRLLVDRDNYAAAFGEQWLRWRKTQLDSYSGTTITRDRLHRCLKKDGLRLLSQAKSPVHVLEVGCGAGRFTEILLEFPSVRLTSLDFSSAVEANQLNFPQDVNKHRIVQADVMQPPFESQQYDMVVCLGVIQHTPNPESTISKLFEQVKPGGLLVLDHYTFEIRRLTKITANLIRPMIKRLPSGTRFWVVEKLVDTFFPIHKAIRNIPFAQQIFSRISPITTYFHAYPQIPESLQKEWSLLDTHDGLTDWYKHLRSLGQIKATLEKIGAIDLTVDKGGNGIEAVCRRPVRS
jgi:2-polyprenyl-3-methyl-5-hydroxy-6-metoxy-1,4-benzoquinol methylase